MMRVMALRSRESFKVLRRINNGIINQAHLTSNGICETFSANFVIPIIAIN